MTDNRSLMWKEIWNRKAFDIKDSDRTANGWEKTSMKGIDVFNNIEKSLGFKNTDNILEVGCGAGYLSNFFIEKKYNYTGIDYSENMIKECKKKYDADFFVGNATCLKFKDNTFDYVFAYSVLHYLNNSEEAFIAIKEALRVAKKGVFIGDLPEKSHSKDHLLFNKSIFNSKFVISNGFYTSDRFNIYCLKDTIK